MTDLVKIDPKEYGLEESKAKQIEAVFLPMIEKMKELETEYNQVIALPIDKEVCKKAKELRIKYVKVRTGTTQIHKEAKAFYLAGGRFVDGWKNAQLYASQGIEKKLEDIENYFENIEAEKKAQLQEERIKMLTPYWNQIEGFPEPNLSDMPHEIWTNFLAGAKKAHEDRIENERKVEEERIAKEKAEIETKLAKEKAEREERERICQENARLKEEEESKEKQRKAEFEILRIEKAKQEESQRIERERVEREHQIKLAAERKAQQVKLELERKERERVERELQKKKEAEKKAKDEIEAARIAKEKAEKEALKAPDKDKINIFAKQIKALAFPVVKSNEAKKLIQDAERAIIVFADKLIKKAEEL